MESNWIEPKVIEETLDACAYQNKFVENFLAISNSGLETKPLNEICKDIYRGTTPNHTKEYINNGALLLKTTNIRSNILDLKNIFYMTNETYNNQGRYKLNNNDICITIMGATEAIIGRSWVYNENIGKACFSDGVAKLEGVNIDPYYLSTYINSKYGHLSIVQWSGSSTRSYITNSQLGKIRIPIPNTNIQKYIGDKIRKCEELKKETSKLKKEANRILDKYLNYKNKEDLKRYSSKYILSKNVVDRIDSEYYNEKYLRIENILINSQFEVKSLKEICVDIANGKTYKTCNVKNNSLNIGVGELGEWFVTENEEKYIYEKVKEKHILKKGCIVWGNAAHKPKYIGEKVNIIMESGKYVPTGEVTFIEPNTSVINPYYLFLFMSSKWGYMQIQRTIKGMTAHSYPNDIEKIVVPIIDFTDEEYDIIKNSVEKSYTNASLIEKLIQEATKDIEDLIEGKFNLLELN